MRLYIVEEHRKKRGKRARWRPINKVFWAYAQAKAFMVGEQAWATPDEKYRVTRWQKVEKRARNKRTVTRERSNVARSSRKPQRSTRGVKV